MKNLIAFLSIMQEIEDEMEALSALDLTAEEIESYLEFFINNYFADMENQDADI